MLEKICMAARFESLEHAGQAYTPIQEILRKEQFTNVSVFRFELHGVAHVAVVTAVLSDTAIATSCSCNRKASRTTQRWFGGFTCMLMNHLSLAKMIVAPWNLVSCCWSCACRAVYLDACQSTQT